MQTGRKITAVALALAFLLMQASMALAADVTTGATAAGEGWVHDFLLTHDDDFAAALEAGREVYSVSSASWYGLPLLDDETNGLIESLLDSIDMYSYTAKPDGNSAYSVYDLMMGGASAFRGEMVVQDDQFYFNSPHLAAPIAVVGEQQGLLLYQNLIAYMNAIGSIDMDMEGQDALVYSQMPFQSEDPEALMEAMNLQPLVDALTAWGEGIAEGEPYDGEIVSSFDADTSSAMLYQVTKDDLMALCETVLPLLRDNTALWEFALESADTADFTNDAGEPMTTDEMIAEIQAAFDELDLEDIVSEIPDDITMYYAECFDASGAVSTNIVHISVPSEYTDSASEFYAEWLEDCSRITVSILDDYDDGVTIDVDKGAADAEGMTDQLTASLWIISSGEADSQFVVDAVWGTAETEDGAETNGVLTLGVVDVASGEEMGIVFTLYELKTKTDADVSDYTLIDVSLLVGDAEMTFMSLACLTETCDPQGMPFDPADPETAFEYPGAMDAAEFEVWMNETILPATMQAGFSMMSLLPQDVFAWFVAQSGMMTGM